jgi:dsDNA-specific endonuclease/ATPase MutS2
MNESRSIDLHNCTVSEAIGQFVRFYNGCVRSGYRGRIEVIHGYGSSGVGGVIKQELRKYLAAHSETFGEYLAGESLRNPGVTILYAKESQAAMPRGQGAVQPLTPAQEAMRRAAMRRRGKS